MDTRTILGLCAAAILAPALAQTGAPVPSLAALDRAVPALLDRYQIPGASLAVAYRGRLVYARGFGWADHDLRIPVQPDSLFRVGSISKPITTMAALKLVQDGKLTLDARIVPLLPPDIQFTDPRWNSITIRHLMRHSGGWDAEQTFDPFGTYDVIESLGFSLPLPRRLTVDDIIRFMAARPLQFDPGARYAYSNFGMAMLGRIVERVAGMPYERYVQQAVLEPMGIQRAAISGSTALDRRLGEVTYHSTELLPALYPGLGPLVPAPDGGYPFEVIQGAGAWMASPIDIVRFADGVDGRTGPALLNPNLIREITTRPSYDRPGDPFYGLGWQIVDLPTGTAWVHDGAIEGTFAFLYRGAEGITFALALNTFPQAEGFEPEMIGTFLELLLPNTNWPQGDAYESLLPRARPLVSGVVDAASHRPAIGARTLVSLWGMNLGPVEGVGAALDPSGRVSTRLAGVEVLFDGVPAPLLYVSRNQINAVAPVTLTGASTSVAVTVNGQSSSAFAVPVQPAAPGLFTVSGNGRGGVIALNSDQKGNGESSPAERGSIVTIWSSGWGDLAAPLANGEVASGVNRLRETPGITIDGQAAEVLFAGAAPGFVNGVHQINLRVPASARPGRVLIQAQAAGQPSRPGVWIWIR